jgi:hypothetical protein
LGLKILNESKPGLEILTSEPRKTATIVFVHGLGGSAIETWTDPKTGGFWPAWLSEDEGFESVRITTFGYNADFHNILAPQSILGISDFSKQLLDSLDLYYTKYGDVVLFVDIIMLMIKSDHFCWP